MFRCSRKSQGGWWRGLLIALLAIALPSCLGPSWFAPRVSPDRPVVMAVGQTPPLRGQVQRLARATQATIGQIGAGATVSLIDTGTNNTVSTALADANGNFVLTFSGGFVPIPGRVYYLEAIKGLSSGGQPNGAGADAARVRTLVQYQNAWVSLVPGTGVNVNEATTAVSIIASLRSAFSPVNYAQLMGSVNGSSFTPAGGIALTEFNQTYALVLQALASDTDPLDYVIYDSGSGSYLPQPRGVAISAINPASGSYGATVTITGQNVGSSPIVRFNGTVGTGTAVNGPQTQITTQVPVGATSGPLTVQIGALVFTAGNFAVANWDGHNVFDAANNLYVASAGTNTLYQVSPAGAVSVYCQDPALQQPDGLAFDRAGNLYVSNWQNNLILKVTPAKVVSVYASGGGLANPAGLCFDATGSLYVANYTGGNVLRVAPGGGTPTTLATMANPTAIAAAPDGTFWVTAGGGSGNLDKVTYQGGVSLASTNTFANPSGIAFDSTGNAYVSERGNNRIDKVTPGGIVSTFCSMTGASNLAMRTDGVLFAASNLNFIESFASNGAPNGSLAQAVVADSQQGSSIKVDRNGNLLVCSGFGQGTNTQAVYRALWYPASSSFGLFSPLASSLPNPSAVTVDQNNNVYIGDWTDGLYRINAGGGAPYKVATGFNQVAGLACDTSTGKVYASAASGSSNGVFRFNGGTAERAYGFGEAFNGICQASPSGTFYVADAGLGQILSITSTGDLTVYKTGFSDPEDVAVGPDGSLYVAENGNNRIQRIDKNTLAVTTWASGVQDPEGIVFDNAGNLYATNYDSNNRVQRIPAGGGSPISYAINIPLPYGLAIDPAGNLFVSSRTNQSIFRIPAGVSPPFDASASTWATGVFPYNGLTPRRMAFKPATGELYFTADGDERLFRVPAAGGNWTLYSSALRRDLLGLVLGQDGNFYGSNEGYVQRLYVPGLTTDLLAQLPRSPRAIAVDAANRYVYVADGELNTIVRIDSVTDAVRTYDLQTGNNLYGVAISPVDNRLYFELDNGTARVFTNLASGTFTTYGSGVGGGREISFDAAGNMYGVTWTNSQYQDHGTVVMTPVGGGVGAPVTSVWFNGTSF